MSSIYVNPTAGKISKGFRPSYPADPNVGYSYAQEDVQQVSEGLYRSTAIGKMMVDSLVRFVIGKGLTPMSAPESEILGWTSEQADRFQRQAEAYWRLMADSPNIDYYGKDSFRQLQAVAMRNILVSGDTLLHLGFRRLRNGTVLPFVQLISGRMVCQDFEQDTDKSVGGVIINPETGRETGYKLRVLDALRSDTCTYRTVSRYNRLGRLEFDLIQLGKTDPSVIRGIPLLASVRDSILDLNKFMDNHLAQSAVGSIFTAVIEKEIGSQHESSFLDKLHAGGAVEEIDQGERRMNLGCGYIIELEDGEKMKTIERSVQGDDYSSYLKSNIGIIASALGMSYEVAMNSFNASFSASRAGLASAEKNFAILRDEFCTKFSTPVWKMVIEHGILSGAIDAPGFEKGGIYRDAVLSVSWTGVTPPQVDPRKEVQAYIDAINSGLCTHEYAVRQLYGLDYDETHERWMREMADMPNIEQGASGIYEIQEEEEEEE